MRCVSPFVKKSEKYDVWHEFPCGKCPACRTRRVQAWAFRLLQEVKNHERVFFVTLTYEDDQLPYVELDDGLYEATLNRKQVQDYVKRLRKRTGAKFKYYLCGEYGGHTARPHYHCIFFSDNQMDETDISLEWRSIQDGCLLGHCYFGDVRSASIKYVVGYLNKLEVWSPDDRRQKPFSNMSKGIGLSALDSQMVKRIKNGVATEEEFIYFEGYKISVPRYFRDKVFPEGIERVLPPARKFTSEDIRNAVNWTASYQKKHGKRKN